MEDTQGHIQSQINKWTRKQCNSFKSMNTPYYHNNMIFHSTMDHKFYGKEIQLHK